MGTIPNLTGRARLHVLVVLILILLLIPIAVMAAGGPFADDDSSMFEEDIEWLAAHGITLGCNPPTNDMFCPADNVTRGQMAAFLHRFADDQANVAYMVAQDSTTAIAGVDLYETVLELTGLPAGTYQVMAKGEFQNTEVHTEGFPRCKLVAGTEFDTTSPNVVAGEIVPWTMTALTYLAEDNSTVHLDCRDHGELVSLSYTRLTAVGVNDIVIQSPSTP